MKDLTNKQVNANMQKGVQTYTGQLHFYEDGYVYKAKAANSNIVFDKILYSDIYIVKKSNTLGIVPNGIVVCTKHKEEYKYVVSSRKTVLDYLESKIG